MGHGGDEPTICIWKASEEQLPRSSLHEASWEKRLIPHVEEG